MKIALVGYGKMGQMIESLTPEYNAEIVAKFWDEHPMADDQKTRDEIDDADVLIDFSVPACAFKNIELSAAFGKPIVVGTTAWLDRLNEAAALIEKSGTALVYGSNFSLGVNLFYRIVRHAAFLMSSFDAYDPFMQELHHQFKLDAPSGTALVIKDLIQESYTKEVPVCCVRSGYIPGTHSVAFDSEADTIELTHTARNRQGFAKGALLAAKWILGKQGVYEFGEVMDGLLKIKSQITNDKR